MLSVVRGQSAVFIRDCTDERDKVGLQSRSQSDKAQGSDWLSLGVSLCQCQKQQ